LVILQQEKFIAIFAKYYPALEETLKPFFDEYHVAKAERKAIFDPPTPMTQKAWKVITQIAPLAFEAVLALVAK
jgi:hypothetical protein